MKLRELAQREEIITVKDEQDNKIDVLLTSLTSTDIQERNEYYDEAHKKSVAHAHDRAPLVFKEVDALTDEELKTGIYQNDSMRLEHEVDLMEIENEKNLTPEQVKEQREKEKKKVLDLLKKSVNELSREDMKVKTQIYILRTIQTNKFIELMEVPSLVLIVKDPETKERMLSMDPDSEDYVGHVKGEVLQDLLDKSFKFRDQIDAMGLRGLMEDPSFLLSSPLVRSEA